MKHYPTAISLYNQMKLHGIHPDLIVSSIIIDCFCRLSKMNFTFSEFAMIFKLGYDPNTIIFGTLMHGLSLKGEVKKALNLRDKVVSDESNNLRYFERWVVQDWRNKSCHSVVD